MNTPANDTHADAIDELTAMHGRLIAEAATVAKLIGTLQEAGAATTRELARYQLGSQLGGTKLALRLGCGRSYALRLMEGELAPHVRTRADGSRWVPASAVDDWLAAREQVAA